MEFVLPRKSAQGNFLGFTQTKTPTRYTMEDACTCDQLSFGCVPTILKHNIIRMYTMGYQHNTERNDALVPEMALFVK